MSDNAGMTIAAEVDIVESNIGVLRDNGADLLEQHYQEIARRKNVLKLDPHWDSYTQLEDHDMLVTLLAIRGEEIVGYSIVILSPMLHYRQQTMAQSDVLFIREDCRGLRLFERLREASEDAARAAKADMFTWHAKPGTSLDRILDRRADYSIHDVIYSKEL